MGPSGNLKAEYFSNLDREGFKNKINQKKKKKRKKGKKKGIKLSLPVILDRTAESVFL